MKLFVGKRVQHWKTWRAGSVKELPSPEYQTHMLIQFDHPGGSPPEWRRISAFTMETPENPILNDMYKHWQTGIADVVIDRAVKRSETHGLGSGAS